MSGSIQDLNLSRLCLGTMTWGSQTPRDDARRQLNFAYEAGINFIDAGEMYPIPPTAQSQGLSEVIIGEWLKDRGLRHAFALAGKVVGNGEKTPFLRDGAARLDKTNIDAAVEASLRRLQTDHIDLFQIHWPDRRTNNFGQLGLIEADRDGTPIVETLQALSELVSSGKIRFIGLSNETPWGVMKFLALSEQFGLSRVTVLQNPYNLLNRSAEIGLTEVLLQENVAFAAYSPLAFGTLSGKYANGQRPQNARLTLYPQYTRYSSPRAQQAIEDYVALAQRYGRSPTQMAIAFSASRPFVTSVVLGASTADQLRENTAAAAERLPSELLLEIDRIHENNPNPAP
jgi:aryl-alcohol dehydrogenase-like predicted oxidoreductase